MIDIFEKNEKLDEFICHSGGAEGSDTIWEKEGVKYGVKTKAYSYKTKKHNSKNKVEISDKDYNEGVEKIKLANKTLMRFGIHRYMNLLARNWTQVKYSSQILAIGYIVNPGDRGKKNYKNKSKYQVVDGGTGYAIQMAINEEKLVFVFDQDKNKWFRWSFVSLSFIESKTPKMNFKNFAGIGTREIKQNGINAIKEVYKQIKNEK